MPKKSKREKYQWIPRLFSIFLIIYFGLFTLEVWYQDVSLAQKLIDLIIHLIPSIVMLICLLVSWRFQTAGGMMFVVAGFGSAIFFNTFSSLTDFILISFPIFISAILFFISDSLEDRPYYRWNESICRLAWQSASVITWSMCNIEIKNIIWSVKDRKKTIKKKPPFSAVVFMNW